MPTYTARPNPQYPTSNSVYLALLNAGAILNPWQVGILSDASGSHVMYTGGFVPTLQQQMAVDLYMAGVGQQPSYSMTVTAPATAAVGSTVTVTADTGDATYTGTVEFYVGGALQATVTASAGQASCGITSSSSGTVTVYAWASPYGYNSAQINFQ